LEAAHLRRGRLTGDEAIVNLSDLVEAEQVASGVDIQCPAVEVHSDPRPLGQGSRFAAFDHRRRQERTPIGKLAGRRRFLVPTTRHPEGHRDDQPHHAEPNPHGDSLAATRLGVQAYRRRRLGGAARDGDL